MKNKLKLLALIASCTAPLLQSCSKMTELCYLTNIKDFTNSVKVELVKGSQSKDGQYIIKSLDEEIEHHFAGYYSQNVPIYDDGKLVLPKDDEYSILEEKVLASNTLYVDFYRNYMSCSDENSSPFDKYDSYYTEPIYEDYTFANTACVYFEKMSEDFYKSSKYDIYYGRFR